MHTCRRFCLLARLFGSPQDLSCHVRLRNRSPLGPDLLESALPERLRRWRAAPACLLPENLFPSGLGLRPQGTCVGDSPTALRRALRPRGDPGRAAPRPGLLSARVIFGSCLPAARGPRYCLAPRRRVAPIVVLQKTLCPVLHPVLQKMCYRKSVTSNPPSGRTTPPPDSTGVTKNIGRSVTKNILRLISSHSLRADPVPSDLNPDCFCQGAAPTLPPSASAVKRHPEAPALATGPCGASLGAVSGRASRPALLVPLLHQLERSRQRRRTRLRRTREPKGPRRPGGHLASSGEIPETALSRPRR